MVVIDLNTCLLEGEKGLRNNLKEEKRKGKKKAYSTCCSQAVTHPSTGQARRCLTSVIRREPVYSAWYGRRQQWMVVIDLTGVFSVVWP